MALPCVGRRRVLGSRPRSPGPPCPPPPSTPMASHPAGAPRAMGSGEGAPVAEACPAVRQGGHPAPSPQPPPSRPEARVPSSPPLRRAASPQPTGREVGTTSKAGVPRPQPVSVGRSAGAPSSPPGPCGGARRVHALSGPYGVFRPPAGSAPGYGGGPPSSTYRGGGAVAGRRHTAPWGSPPPMPLRQQIPRLPVTREPCFPSSPGSSESPEPDTPPGGALPWGAGAPRDDPLGIRAAGRSCPPSSHTCGRCGRSSPTWHDGGHTSCGVLPPTT